VLSASDIGNGNLAGHMAMPRLMGAPAYARPKRYSEGLPRPLDTDDLPLEAHRSAEERDLATAIAEGRHLAVIEAPEALLRPSDSTGLRAIAARLIRARG
jgi:hypothetical protein